MKWIDTKMPLGIHRDLAIVAISALIWGLGEGLFIFFLPLALQRWETDAIQIGAVLSMIGVTMAVVQVPAGYFSDRFGTRPIIFASLLLVSYELDPCTKSKELGLQSGGLCKGRNDDHLTQLQGHHSRLAAEFG